MKILAFGQVSLDRIALKSMHLHVTQSARIQSHGQIHAHLCSLAAASDSIPFLGLRFVVRGLGLGTK